ncbi:Egg protein [Fasciola hepatica]|uniref:Egg protein n=1 Tax=Fasciola hepatica TaxID=6192 RepID=A0A4E0R920_FASHE|nr:Egg protein [Fasciola hepatica]
MSSQRAALEALQFCMIEFTALTPGQAGSGKVSGGKQSRRSGFNVDGALSEPRSNTGEGSRYTFCDADGSGTGLIDKAGSGVGYFSTMRPAKGAVTKAVQNASAHLHEELELEIRTGKRRMRLLLAVEEAFAHVRRLASVTCRWQHRTGVNAAESANQLTHVKDQAYSGEITGPLRSCPGRISHTDSTVAKVYASYSSTNPSLVDMVINHLALYLAYGLSLQAFFERLNPAAATPQLDAAAADTAIRTARRGRKQQKQRQRQQVHQRSRRPGQPDAIDSRGPLLPKHVHPGGQQTWSTAADRALSGSQADKAIFQLRRCSEISLMCTVRRLPLIRLIEVLETLEVGLFALNTDNAA